MRSVFLHSSQYTKPFVLLPQPGAYAQMPAALRAS
jgi:hypothetical protein